MTETKHTQTPWEKCGGATPYYTCIKSGDEYIVYGMADNQSHKEHGHRIKAPDMWTQQANAAHIVKCVNMHDELVEALKEAREEYLGGFRFHEIPKETPYDETLKKAGAI